MAVRQLDTRVPFVHLGFPRWCAWPPRSLGGLPYPSLVACGPALAVNLGFQFPHLISVTACGAPPPGRERLAADLLGEVLSSGFQLPKAFLPSTFPCRSGLGTFRTIGLFVGVRGGRTILPLGVATAFTVRGRLCARCSGSVRPRLSLMLCSGSGPFPRPAVSLARPRSSRNPSSLACICSTTRPASLSLAGLLCRARRLLARRSVAD